MENMRASFTGERCDMSVVRFPLSILVIVGMWTIWNKALTFSEKISRRKDTCDGRGRYSRRSEGLPPRLCPNKKLCRSEGVLPDS